MTRFGLPHSETPGSKDVCSSPRFIAACHVLHRLHVPRHSPYALNNFTKVVSLRNATTSISTLSKNILCSTWEHNSSFLKKTGGASRDRTDDLLNANQALSQLSYSPMLSKPQLNVGLRGFEPRTSSLSGMRSNQLSYKPKNKGYA